MKNNKEKTIRLKAAKVRKLYRSRGTLLRAKMQARELWRTLQKVK